MFDSVYPERMTAVTRDGQTELRGRPFGPAGTSAVEFSDGTVWEVDHADPAQLVSLLFDGELEQSRLAVELLGQERFDWVCAQVDAQRAAKKPGKRLKAEVPGEPDGRWGQSLPRSRGTGDVAALAGTAVMMADLATDESLAPLVRLAAGLEFLARVRDGFLGSVFDGAVEPVARQMYDVALLVGPEDVAELGRGAEKPLHRFESLVQWARGDMPSLELPLTRVLEALGAARSRRQADGAPRAAGLQGNAGGYLDDAPVAALREAADLHSLTLSPGPPPPEDFIEVEMPDAGQVVVRVSRTHEDRWVRILKASGLVPLALVPLDDAGLLLEALAVVPSDLEAADLVVELVDPDEATGADRPLSLVRAAVEAGRAAARYERLGRPDDAADAWRECSRLWAGAGDDRRAVLAQERAHLGAIGRGARLGAFVADELLAVSMGERPGF